MINQIQLPFKIIVEKVKQKFSSFAGILPFMAHLFAIKFDENIDNSIGCRVKEFGYRDSQVIIPLILMIIAGGDCVDDIKIIDSDPVILKCLKKLEKQRIPKRIRKFKMKFLKDQIFKTLPSPSSIFRYLSSFHNVNTEVDRISNKAYIPEKTDFLKRLIKVSHEYISIMQEKMQLRKITLDMDATIIETSKKLALNSYKTGPSFQPEAIYCPEFDAIFHSEFRDGNVPARFDYLRLLIETLSMVPTGVNEIFFRSDSAGYQHELLRYCEEGKNKRFGKIKFAIGCELSAAFRNAVKATPESDWHPIYNINSYGETKETGQEWAEICFVPNNLGLTRKNTVYRFIATREIMATQLKLPMDLQLKLSFPNDPDEIELNDKRYKIRGIVTNFRNYEKDGLSVIKWCRERCGMGEKVHSIMKNDLAGGRLPSGKFGVNTAWWWINILTYNIVSFMKNNVFGEKWKPARMKKIRFSLINIPCRLPAGKNQILVKINENHPNALEIKESLVIIERGMLPAP
jgi:hypothetical protein